MHKNQHDTNYTEQKLDKEYKKMSDRVTTIMEEQIRRNISEEMKLAEPIDIVQKMHFELLKNFAENYTDKKLVQNYSEILEGPVNLSKIIILTIILKSDGL